VQIYLYLRSSFSPLLPAMDKLISFALFIFCHSFLSSCLQAQSPEICTKHLEIKEASQQTWGPGIVKKNAEQAGGVKYEVKIKIRKNGHVTFKSLIVDNQILPVEISQNGNRNMQGPFAKGDEVTLIARTDKEKPAEVSDEVTNEKMQQRNAVAAILYDYKKKQYLHTLKKFSTHRRDKLTQ
jgi:hypothetical protein